MYCLSDKQIDYILNDISARGVEMESLQQNLLDHVCCIIEQNLEENGDFESFYQKTITTFYKNELWEIEEETISLLTFKNYYAMKKSMLISGTISVTMLTVGILFKFLHWPGANAGVVLGVSVLSLVFLPLLFILKMREKQNVKDKLIIAFGALSGILICLGIMFKLQHWPFANIMINGSMAVMLLLFLPFYFFAGIRNPDTKVNTTVSSIILLAVCGLLLALVRTPRSSNFRERVMTETYLRNQSILQNEIKAATKTTNDNVLIGHKRLSNKIVNLCEELKNKIVEGVTGSKTLETDFYAKDLVIGDHSVYDVFSDTTVQELTQELINHMNEYKRTRPNYLTEDTKHDLTDGMFLKFYKSPDMNGISTFESLQQLTQLQLVVLQNERGVLAIK